MRFAANRAGTTTERALCSALVCLLICSTVAVIAQPALAESAGSVTVGFTLYSPQASAAYGNAAVTAKNSTALAWHLAINGTLPPVNAGSASYTAEMLVNGTTYVLATLTLTGKGTAEASGYLVLHPGTYALGVNVVQGKTLVLVGKPAPQYLTLGQSTTSSTTTTASTSTITIGSIRSSTTGISSTSSETHITSRTITVTVPKSTITTSVTTEESTPTRTSTTATNIVTTTITAITTATITAESTSTTAAPNPTITTERTSSTSTSETASVAPPNLGMLSAVRFVFYRPGETNASHGVAEVSVGSSNSSRLMFYVETTALVAASTTEQSVVELTVNGTSYDAGTLTLTSAGGWTLHGSLSLPQGNYHRYVLGIEILSGSTLVLVGEPTPQVLVLGSGILPPPPTALGNYVLSTGADKFVLYAPGQTTTADGIAGVGAYNSTTILVSVGVYSITRLSPSVDYSVVISLNGTTHEVATLHVNSEGGGSAFGSLKATPGVYQVQVQVLSGTSVVLLGEPSPQILRLGASVNPGGGVLVPVVNAVRFSLEQPGGSVAFGVAYVGTSASNSAELRFSVLAYSSAGLSPISKYGIVLSVNGTTYTAGILTVTKEGTGTASGSVLLPAGNYRVYNVGIEILSGTSVVLVGEPTPQTLVFRPRVVNPPPLQTYAFSFVAVDGSGVKGKAGVLPQGTNLRIYAVFGNLTANAQYTLDLIANGTAHQVGTLVFGDTANVEMQTDASLSPGTWEVGFVLVANGITVLQSNPVAATIVLQVNPHAVTAGAQGSTAIGSNKTVVQSIQQAQNDGTIPVVVQVSGNRTSASLLSSQFSVSLGQATNGVLVTITGTNVHGSRILLVNFDQPIDLQSKALSVTLDNQTVTEASSLTQLFGSPTAPLFVVVTTSSGTQLLISIPHFSTHVIQISELPVVAALASFVADARVLLAAVLVTTVVFAVVYARRERVFVAL
jgi:hypothetical protein